MNMDPKLHETNVEQTFGRVIAVDYDGCLAKNGAWPEAGELDMHIVAELLKAREEGATLILWTCRTEYALEQAVKSCRDVGLEFDAVNDYPPLQASMFETLARKVWATEYWDDKSVCVRFGEDNAALDRDAEVDRLRTENELLTHQLTRYRAMYGELK